MVACNKSTQENSKQIETKQVEIKKEVKEEGINKIENLGVEYKLLDKWKAKEKYRLTWNGRIKKYSRRTCI